MIQDTLSPEFATLPVAPVDCLLPEPSGISSPSNHYERIIAKMARQHRLLSVHWELTYRCNESCTHCYLDVLPPNVPIPGELTTDEAKQVIDQIAAIGALFLTFSGGEVLVRRDFFEIAEYARSKRLAIRLMTNGILINPQLADRIAALHPTGVEISVYGADAETHEAITQRPRSFELTIRAAQLLNERGIHTVMKTPLMRENVRQLSELRALASSIGATLYYDPTITAKDSGDTAPLKHRLTYDDLIWLFREDISSDTTLPPKRDGDYRTCNIGLSRLLIDPYGNVFPCVQARVLAGNVRTQSVKRIWENAPVFHETSALTFSELPICRTCNLSQICARCHGMALLEGGDLRAPSLSSCLVAMARRQVYAEKGILPADFPVPAHLKNSIFDKFLAHPNGIRIESLQIEQQFILESNLSRG